MAISIHPKKNSNEDIPPSTLTYRWFLSYRMMTASIVHMMNANLGMAMVCMVDEDYSPSIKNESNALEYELKNFTSVFGAAPRVHWSSEDQGWIFAAFNAGLLCMLFTGFLADKFNAKYMIIVSVLLASMANIAIPLTATFNVGYAIAARFMVGLAEALLQPAINSLVTRWFPASERSYALGLATGGRQFVANSLEQMGQKRINRKVPWKCILKSPPVWAALVSVVCHEFPLMTMIMFLPAYLHDALPTLALWISKITSSWLNTWLQENTKWGVSYISRVLNAIGN
uniref:Major facilitator superfamily (MFS) profile domain-containing protein n=1 Tax=Meloidogyne javanica TaxID=6303 RepID=A0A915N707_MELJA